MYVQNLIEHFYQHLIDKRILLLVNFDVDAICACKILQSLLKCDNVSYTVAAVNGIESLNRSYQEHAEDTKCVVLINCGGTIDIVELLQPPEDVVFFILDSHKPTDVCNIYSNGQVKVLEKDNEEVPKFDDIFRDDEDDEENEDDENIENEDDEAGSSERSSAEDRLKKAESKIMKRRELKAWEERRNKLMFEYTQFSYYSRSSAMVMYELSWRLSKDSADLLWWAIIGLTEQFVMEKIEPAQYVIETGTVQSHVSRIQNVSDNKAPTSVIVSLEKDIRLSLFRHWSIEQSLRCSPYTAAQLKLWTLNGDKRLHRLLVDMGLPLAQAKQMFNSMDLMLRKEFLPCLEKLSEKYDLPNIVFLSFMLQHGYTNKFCATDVVYSLLALLEHGIQGGSSDSNMLHEEGQRFQVALDALSRSHGDLLKRGIDAAKQLFIHAARLVQVTMESHLVFNAGPFLYFTIPESNLTAERTAFAQPHWLGVVARWVQRCHRVRSALPMLAAIALPIPSTENLQSQSQFAQMSLLLGVPPLADDSTRNLFGKAFEQAALKSKSDVVLDYFDSSVITINTQHINKFLDALTSLLS